MRWGRGLALAALAVACDPFEGESGTVKSVNDAGPTPVDAMTDAGGDAAVAPDGNMIADGNLIADGSFEEGALGEECGGHVWASYQSTSKVVTGGRAGANACLFCGDPGQTGFTIDSPRFAPALKGQTYKGHAWFKLQSAVTVTAALVIRAWDDKGTKFESQGNAKQTSSTDWVELVSEFEVPGDVPARTKWMSTSS